MGTWTCSQSNDWIPLYIVVRPERCSVSALARTRLPGPRKGPKIALNHYVLVLLCGTKKISNVRVKQLFLKTQHLLSPIECGRQIQSTNQKKRTQSTVSGQWKFYLRSPNPAPSQCPPGGAHLDTLFSFSLFCFSSFYFSTTFPFFLSK